MHRSRSIRRRSSGRGMRWPRPRRRTPANPLHWAKYRLHRRQRASRPCSQRWPRATALPNTSWAHVVTAPGVMVKTCDISRSSRLSRGLTVAEFLRRRFAGPEYGRLRHSAWSRATTRPTRSGPASWRLGKNGWMADGRIIGGYGALVELLTAECRNHDVAMHISAQPSPPSKRAMGGGWSVAPKATLMSAMP
jgi:hypothetical protein